MEAGNFKSGIASQKQIKSFYAETFGNILQEMIINEPVEEWPKVRCLISFASSGFPLAKAIEYVNLVPRGMSKINNLMSCACVKHA
eukprot:6458185-Amphidinium_carterae.2